jgi:hypothetical protein
VTSQHADHPHRPWPLLLLAAPAFVAIWSGWVGLGELTGFGTIHPLPGTALAGWTLNTAITLPIGVESYAAYALRVWLTGTGNDRAVAFARSSAVASLALGAAGQVAFHLMVAAGVTRAPWWITTIVACLPVAVLGMGATLAHLRNAPVPVADLPVPARSGAFHLAAGLRVDVERGVERGPERAGTERVDHVVVDVVPGPVPQPVPATVPERVPHAVPSIESGTAHTERVPGTPGLLSPREAAYAEWLNDPATWDVDRIHAELGTPNRKAATQVLQRWRTKAGQPAGGVTAG